MTTLLIAAAISSFCQLLIIMTAINITDSKPFTLENLKKVARIVFTKPISIPFLLPFIGLILLIWEGATSEHR